LGQQLPSSPSCCSSSTHAIPRVSDATFASLRKQFNDREIVEITWLNALENYYNLINIPLEI
jgi:alkylhydroperoxidase family enzyme